MKITYVENGVRFTRECYAYDPQYNNANVPALIYKDVEDDFNNPQYRFNILTPGTIIEKVE